MSMQEKKVISHKLIMIASSIKMNIACMKLLHERKFNFDKIP